MTVGFVKAATAIALRRNRYWCSALGTVGVAVLLASCGGSASSSSSVGYDETTARAATHACVSEPVYEPLRDSITYVGPQDGGALMWSMVEDFSGGLGVDPHRRTPRLNASAHIRRSHIPRLSERDWLWVPARGG